LNLCPFINTEQGKISGVKGSTGNKAFIGDKRPPINTEQDNISGVKGSTGNERSFVSNITFISC
jgi:hypothetical protein